MSIKRDDNTESTIKFTLQHHETFDLEPNNNEKLLNAIEYYKEKIVASIITVALNNKTELATQIERTLNHLKEEKDSLEKQLKDIEEKEVLVIDPNIYESFQERKHEHDMRILVEQKKKVDRKLERVNELIKNFGEPSKFIETLINSSLEDKGNRLIYECIEDLNYNSINAGLKLSTKDTEEGIVELHIDKIEALIKLAMKKSFINELEELSTKIKEIELENSTKREDEELTKQEQKEKIAKKAEAVASEYMQSLLTIFESEDELIEMQEERDLVKEGSFIQKLFIKDNTNKEKNYDAEIERLKTKIETYREVLNGKDSCTQKAYSSLRKFWKEQILKLEDYSENEDDFKILKRYLDEQDDKKETSRWLVERAEEFCSKAQSDSNRKVLKLLKTINSKNDITDEQIEELINNASPEIQDAWYKGLDINRINDLHRLRSDFSTGVDEHIVPAVALLILYELLKEENITTIEQSREYGYEIPNLDELRKKLSGENRKIVKKLAEVEMALKEVVKEQAETPNGEQPGESENNEIEL